MKRILIATSALVAFASVEASAQQVLSLVWKKEDSSPTGYSWFTSPALTGDNNTRGMAKLSGGNLLIADRSPADAIHRIDPTTGAEVLPALSNPTVINQGTFTLNKVGVSGDNKIYLANLAISGATTSSGTAFKIYRFDNDTQTTPTLVYSLNAINQPRLGDDMDVTGSGNNTKILVAGSTNLSVAVFSTTDAGATFQKTAQFVPSAPATAGTPNVCWDDGSTANFWFRQSTAGVAARKYDATTGVGVTGATGVISLGAATVGANSFGAIDVKTYGGNKLMATAPGFVTTGRTTVRAQVHILANPENSTGTTPAYWTTGLEKAATGANWNANGSGDILIEPSTDRLYVLYTNNSISAWSFLAPASASGEWNLLEE